MSNPTDLLYTETHEWVRVDGNIATIGITDFAQSELGSVVYIDLPGLGDEVTQGDEFGEIESHKAVSDLKSPVSGTVVEANTDVAEFSDDNHPVNVDPYQGGWLLKVELSDAGELSNLMNAEQYAAFLG